MTRAQKQPSMYPAKSHSSFQQKRFFSSLLITELCSFFPSGPKCLLIFAIALQGETRGWGMSGVMDSRSPITSSETSAQILYWPRNSDGSSGGRSFLGGAKAKSRLYCVLRLEVPSPHRCSERRGSLDRVLVFLHLDPGYTHPGRLEVKWCISEESRSV